MNPRPTVLIGSLIRPYRWLFAAILLTTLVTSVLEALNVAAFFPMFQSFLNPDGTGTNAGRLMELLRWVVNRIPFQDPVLAAISFLVIVTLARVGFQMLQTAMIAHASGAVQHDLKSRLMELYAGFPYAFFLENKQGQLLYNTSTASSRVGVLCQKIPQFFAEGFRVVTVGTIFLMTVPKVAPVLILLGFGYFWLTRVLSGKVSYHIGKARAVSTAAQTSVANEFFTGIRQIRSLGTEPMWLRRFREQSRIFTDLYIRDAIWVALPKVLLETAAILLLLGCILYVRVFRSEQLVSSLPLMAVFAIGLLRFLPSLTNVGSIRMEIVGLLPDAELLYQALAVSVPSSVGGNQIFQTLRSEICLDRVDFAYPARDPLFQGIQLRFERGRTTALVGSSGSGKSTLAYLLLSLLEPTQGRILVDGVDLREIEKRSWRRRIGFVPQDMFIAHASVLENITFGRSEFSEADVRRAAETANAASFIDALPQGSQTVVGERGMKLSGGQQQRLAIARAILANPEILIFDEATSFLDTESEKLVQEALERISKDRTVILIAHRLSTVKNADRIVVLESGKVVEEGSHAELIREEGRYYQLTTTRSGGT